MKDVVRRLLFAGPLSLKEITDKVRHRQNKLKTILYDSFQVHYMEPNEWIDSLEGLGLARFNVLKLEGMNLGDELCYICECPANPVYRWFGSPDLIERLLVLGLP